MEYSYGVSRLNWTQTGVKMLAWFCWCPKNPLWNCWRCSDELGAVCHFHHQSPFLLFFWWEKLGETGGNPVPRALLRSVCLSELMYTLKHMCCSFVFVSCILRAPKCAGDLGSWHSASHLCTQREGRAQRLGHGEACSTRGRLSQVADRTTVIFYSSERCRSPSANGAPHTQTHGVVPH